MTDTSEELRKQVKTRLKRIEGQVRGIIRMVDEGKECQDILVQVKAVRKAFSSVNGVILRRYISTCYEEMAGEDARAEEIERLEKVVNVLSSFVE